MNEATMTVEQSEIVGQVAALLPNPELNKAAFYLGEGSIIKVMDDDWVIGRFVIEDGFWMFRLGDGMEDSE